MGNKKAGFRTDIMANLESEMKSRYEVIDFLSFRSMQYNYAELIKTRTKEKTSEAMSTLYEALWDKAKNDVIFWYENDFVRDDDGEIIFGAMEMEIFKTIQPDGSLATTDCRLSNYQFEDETEYDADGVAENCKRWHTMTDQNGTTHDLDVSPYVTMTPEDTKAFSEIAIRLGRVPTTKDNNGVNFDSESIAALLTRLEDEQSYHRDMAEMDQQHHQWDEADVEAQQERWK